LLFKNIKIRIYRTTILPVVLLFHGALRVEHRLRVFERRVPRRIFESGMACIVHGEKGTACRKSVGTPDGKGQLRRARRMWENNKEIVKGGID
jgi:hypothetical protein